ncbi:MAG: PTS sugar transporter subunit IIB [Anaerolineaceae bacterium]|nr:PTS sugar transporter subunit IIB [Anaerolineaceae bacterium]
MQVSIFRIDDRLIHGQIVTKWINEANAKTILVVDDKAAGDKTAQMILKLAVPSGISMQILTKADALAFLKSDKSTSSALLLMKTPAEANAFFELGFKLAEINLGNVSNAKSLTGRTKMLDYIYLEEADIEALKKIKEQGVKIVVKAIPEERAKDIFELIAKHTK